jgi:heme exporter protein A
VGHRFGRQRLFSDLDFALAGTQSICVAGPNGSGKSTLMRILAGLLHPSFGNVVWQEEGRTLDREGWHRRLGFVSPDVHLYGELTLLENLRFFARLRGQDLPALRLDARLDRFGLGGEGNKLYATLSSGQKQRVRYLAALLHDPPVLLLDEPTAYLDRDGRTLVAEVVREHRERGILVLATNEEEEYELADRTIRIRT